MKKEKSFDCLKMKDDAQATLAREWAGLTDEQVRERMRQELATSEDVVARWWRSISQAEQPAPSASQAG